MQMARANDRTVWPDNFDWKAAEVLMEPNE
jgi:hypothetical protein